MTDDRLAATQARLDALDAWYVKFGYAQSPSAPWELTCLSYVDAAGQSHGCLDVACRLLGHAPCDLRDLLAYVEELRGVIHDASQDGGYGLGERAERARVRRLIEAFRANCHALDQRYWLLSDLLEQLEASP